MARPVSASEAGEVRRLCIPVRVAENPEWARNRRHSSGRILAYLPGGEQQAQAALSVEEAVGKALIATGLVQLQLVCRNCGAVYAGGINDALECGRCVCDHRRPHGGGVGL